MKKTILLGLALVVSLFGFEKYFVVERESSSLAVVLNGIKQNTMKNMHNMNHGVIKFKGKDGYLISRDGFIVKFDPVTEKKEAEYKTSKSAIGFVINRYYVAVANYDDKSVDILTRDLKPLQKIRTGELNEDEFETIANSLNKFKNYKLFVDDDGGTNINALKTKLRKLKTQHPDIALAVIDYLQIMSSSNNRDRHIEVADMSRGLKLLARELKMPILALSQLNRGLESRNDKRPIMSDLRESGAIEQDADIILFVYRDDIYRIKAEKEKEKEE